MPRSSRLFPRLGFKVWQVPGVSRAWHRELADRSYLLITDLGGYDLPEPGGPYAGMYLSAQDELIEFVPWLGDTAALSDWLRHVGRLGEFRRRESPAMAGVRVRKTYGRSRLLPSRSGPMTSED